MYFRRNWMKFIGTGFFVLISGCLNSLSNTTMYSMFIVITNNSDNKSIISVKIEELSGNSERETLFNDGFSLDAKESIDKELFEYQSGDFEITVTTGSESVNRKISVDKENLDIEVILSQTNELSLELITH